MRPSSDLHVRFAPFLGAGLLRRVPTWSQVRQGELAMWSTVISTDVTDESFYAGAPLGHPLLRQPVVLWRCGPDHLRIGTGLGSQLTSVVGHLAFTVHRSMPVWDLQLVQTHPHGLDVLEAEIDGMLLGREARHARAMAQLRWILADSPSYLGQFLGEGGWIDRARRFDYPTAAEAGGAVPERFHAVASFADWSAGAFPPQLRALGRRGAVAHLAGLATERFRAGRGFGWFSREVA